MSPVQRNSYFGLFVEPYPLELLDSFITLRAIEFSEELFIGFAKQVYYLFLTHLLLDYYFDDRGCY
jgi:hypothetical protein